jgi:hypothetical protein
MHKTKGFKKRNKYHKKTRKHPRSNNRCKSVSYEINRIQKLINTIKHKNIKLSKKKSNTNDNNINDQ